MSESGKTDHEEPGQKESGSVRKHMYLITEHEKEDRVGCVSFTDSRMSRPLKNEEGPITVLDEEKEGFREIGKKVGMGYHDFETEALYEDNDHVADVIHEKLGDLDAEFLEKAGHDPAEYKEEVEA